MEVKEGYILWLKKLSDIDHTLFQYYPHRPELYNHPVLVVRAAEGSKEVDVCLLTSRATASSHDHNLAIYPQSSSDLAVTPLRLHNDICLRKDGYVCAQKSYLVHASMLKHYDSDTSSDYYHLTGESLAVVREKLGIRSREEIEQQQLEQDEKLRALEADVCRLEWVQIRCGTLEERVRELEAENASLRQAKAEAARHHSFHPEDEKLQLLQNFVQGSRSVVPGVRKTESAESSTTQPLPQVPSSKPTTETAKSESCQDPTPNHPRHVAQMVALMAVGLLSQS